MKVLLLAPHPFYQDRGTPIAVENVLRVLSERDAEVDVLTYHEGRNVTYPGVTLHRIPAIPFVRNVKPGYSFKKLVCDLVMFIKVLRLVGSKKYDLVHAVEESVFMALMSNYLFTIPYVYDMDSSLAEQLIEQMPWLNPLRKLFVWLEGIAVKRALAVAPMCVALAEGICQHKPQKIVVLHDVSLIEEKRLTDFEDNLRQRLDISSLIIMYVGNLQPYQGIDLLLEGSKIALEKQGAADLVIIGGAQDDIEKYQKMARRLGIAQRTHFIGPKPVKHLSMYLAQADILTSPRLKGRNTPMKIYSYLHSGKPLLATDLPTHTQIVSQDSAVLVAPNAAAWAEGTLILLHDPDLRQQVGQAGRHLIETQFSYPVFRDKLNGLFDWLADSVKQAREESYYIPKP